MGYDGYTIQKIYIKDQNKVIQVKNLGIFKDFKTKPFTTLLDYLISEGFLLTNRDKDSNNRITISKPKKQKIMSFQLGYKVKYIENIKEFASTNKDSKVTSFQFGQKINHIENTNNLIAIPFMAGQTSQDTRSIKHNAIQLG